MIFVLLPAFNEADNILPLLNAMDQLEIPIHAVVVNDGSADQTSENTRQFKGSIQTTLIEHQTNQGLAAALKTGLETIHRLANYDDTIITMDADNTHSPIYIPEMIEKQQAGYNIVVASRFATGGKEFGVNRIRKILSHGAAFIYKLCFPGIPLRDFSCGYRCFRASVLKETLEEWNEHLFETPGFTCTGELMLKALCHTSFERVTEIPFELHYENKAGQSKMPAFSTIIGTVSLIWKGRRWLKRAKSHA